MRGVKGLEGIADRILVLHLCHVSFMSIGILDGVGEAIHVLGYAEAGSCLVEMVMLILL